MAQNYSYISGLEVKQDGDDDLYGFANGGGLMEGGFAALGLAKAGMRPPSQGMWGGTGIWQAPLSASMGGAPRTDNRPMSSHRKAGYSSNFDPLKQGILGPPPPLMAKTADSPEEQCLEIERKVNTLIEQSATLSLQGDYPLALEKAKEASRRERLLCKHREQLGLGDQINIDLTYSVHFNLAVQFQKNQLYTEALNTYSLIVRNKQYAQSGRLRVNMGNIYYEQNKVSLAIKMYRLALDQIPNSGKDLKFKIIRNIGNAYVKIGQYQDAIASYETIMEGGNPDIQTGFNLLLCYYALGDRDKLKRHFGKLLNIRKYGATDDDDIDEVVDEHEKEQEVFHVEDHLRAEIRERRGKHMEILLTAARLIAPMLEKDWQQGFDYIIDHLRHYELKDASSRLASEMEMCKALAFLRNKKFSKAIESLKAFEKKDKSLKTRAAINLSYLYFLEADVENGLKHADNAISADKFNARALVNRGCFHYVREEWDKAKELFTTALSYEADCIEAMYNYGLTAKQLGQYEDALTVYKKLQSMVPDSTEVIYQIANLYDLMCDFHTAGEWFNRLASRVPTDPNVLARLGTIYAKEDDEAQAFHYHLEAYRHFPVNMDVIAWLGAYFVRNEVYEKAMQFFERAAQIQPNEVKWQLMVASCHRRIQAYPQAKALYEEIHKKYPDNAECLRYLVHICNDSDLKEEAVEYHKKLKRLEAKMRQDDNGSPLVEEVPPEEEEDVQLEVVGKGSRHNKRQAQAEKQMQAVAKATGEEDEVDLDVDNMLPM